jgi:hypothetical protein
MEEQPGPPVIPWENAERPWPTALMETIALLVTEPRQAFERVPPRGDVLRPVLFAILLGSVGVFFAGVWELTINQAIEGMLPGSIERGAGGQRAAAFAMMLFGPLIVGLGLLVSSAIIHVSLHLVGGARSGFAATLRVLSYCQVGSLALLVPVCGGLLGSVWVLVLEVIGLSVLHRISIGRALLALLIPLVLCCGCAALLFVMFGAALMAGLSGIAP